MQLLSFRFFPFSLLYHLLSSHKLHFYLGLYHCNVQFQQLRNQKVTCEFHSESEGKEKLTIAVMAKWMLNTSLHEHIDIDKQLVLICSVMKTHTLY